jgi:hypothetical protein
MPTISAHVSEKFSAIVETAAKNSPEDKVGPWLAEAAKQRLEREGLMPGDPKAEILAAVSQIGTERALEVLREAARGLIPAEPATSS